MPLKYKKLSEYELNRIKFTTIEASNAAGERVWVKVEPVKNQTTQLIANILDRPQDVSWKHKGSHFEEIDPTGRKQNYAPANSTGSVCVPAGTFALSTASGTQVFLFPLDPLNAQNPVTRMNFVNAPNGTQVIGSVDAASWIGYAAASGAISLV